jgi:hypothetical protein
MFISPYINSIGERKIRAESINDEIIVNEYDAKPKKDFIYYYFDLENGDKLNTKRYSMKEWEQDNKGSGIIFNGSLGYGSESTWYSYPVKTLLVITVPIDVCINLFTFPIFLISNK